MTVDDGKASEGVCPEDAHGLADVGVMVDGNDAHVISPSARASAEDPVRCRRTTRSRSVSTPIGRSPSTTITQPTPSLAMARAASPIVASPGTVTGERNTTSLTFIALPPRVRLGPSRGSVRWQRLDQRRSQGSTALSPSSSQRTKYGGAPSGPRTSITSPVRWVDHPACPVPRSGCLELHA